MSFTNGGITFPDLSFYQGDPHKGMFVNFEVLSTHTQAVILKASQYLYSDPAFEYNWQAAKAAGLLRAAYHFLDYRAPGDEQARYFWNLLMNDPPEGPLVVDFETGSGGDWHKLYDFIYTLQMLSSKPDHKIWVYTGYYYWIDFGPREIASKDWFKRYPLWQPWYGVTPGVIPLTPYPWVSPVAHQHATQVIVPSEWGVYSRELDMNLFNGGREQFAAYWGDPLVSPPPVPQGESMKYKVIWTAGVARRTAPSTATSTTTGQSYPNQAEVEVVQDNIPDLNQPTNINRRWVKFADGLYGASDYPNSIGVPCQRMVKMQDPVVPPTRHMTFKMDGYRQVDFDLEPE